MNYSDRLHNVIPGGAHTYSRGDDQYPSNAPQILSHGKGAYVWDADGNKFLDYGMGLRSVTVGYDNDEISAAGIAEIKKGNNLTRASLTELNAAELMVSLFPWAQMVKFAKNGSTVTTAAIKLSRAYTGRKYVAMCAEHPFFTYDDWFIGTTPMDKGIPEEKKAFSLRFHYNSIESLEKLFEEHPGEIAAVILEPATFVSPCAGDGKIVMENKGCADKTKSFLHQVQALCKKNGTVFILDEMITGFRWDLHGAMRMYDIEPDLATFGKGMANGFALSALIGKREIMELGGIRKEGAERVFLISTTHGSEMSGFGAFIKTVDYYKQHKVTDQLWSFGRKLVTGMNDIAKGLGIEKHFAVEGFACMPYYFTRDAEGNVSFPLRTLFAQEMIRNKILIPWIAQSYSHGDAELELTLKATENSLAVVKKALNEGIDKYLVGNIIKPVFRKYN
ncbi:MAG TPA: glutamate-1-semialdehyde 2,1-aminomutase [Bacteroidia bacterium]|jgi:glutamate-1-semialdehyde 2,1-aminomutase|nr:glutamate-1-semialdehyde 2,1-aminomutase [Bacteroidia bacterium]